MVGFMGAFVAVFIGTIYGAVSGYIGGRVDSIMMRTPKYSAPSFYVFGDRMMAISAQCVVDFRGHRGRQLVEHGEDRCEGRH